MEQLALRDDVLDLHVVRIGLGLESGLGLGGVTVSGGAASPRAVSCVLCLVACVCGRALDLAHLVDLGLVHALERVGLHSS